MARDIARHREKSRLLSDKLRKANPKNYYSKVAKRVKTWREKYPEKSKAHKLVYVEVRAGRIKKVKCFCGNPKAEAHHEDYSNPLEIIWLCKKHHRMADRKELNVPLKPTKLK